MAAADTPAPALAVAPPMFDVSQDRIDRNSDIIERRVAAAALAIQAQFLAVTKQIDVRVDGNKEQSEARIAALKDYADAVIKGLRERNDERWEGMVRAADVRFTNLEKMAQQRNDELRELIFTRLDATETARVIQATEYARRLETLNHAYDRASLVQENFVRVDIYRKDQDKLYEERQTQMTTAETARVSAENAAATNRRGTMIAFMGAGLSVLGLLVSVMLHFATPAAAPAAPGYPTVQQGVR